MRQTTQLEWMLGLDLETAKARAAEDGYTVKAIEQTEHPNTFLITADYDSRRINVITHAGMIIEIESIG